MLAAGDCAHAQLRTLTLLRAVYGNASITGFLDHKSMLIAVHWDQKDHSVSTPWQRTNKETSFSELALHLHVAPATNDRVWPW